MSRVGRKRRMSAYQRRRSIMFAIASITRDGSRAATLSSIARELSLTPSSYLLNVLKSMCAAGELRVTQHSISQERIVYHWHNDAVIRDGCDLPWKCDNLCLVGEKQICIGTNTSRQYPYARSG